VIITTYNTVVADFVSVRTETFSWLCFSSQTRLPNGVAEWCMQRICGDDAGVTYITSYEWRMRCLISLLETISFVGTSDEAMLLGYQSRKTSESIRIFALVQRSNIVVMKNISLFVWSSGYLVQADRSNPSSFTVVAQTRERYESILKWILPVLKMMEAARAAVRFVGAPSKMTQN
jgi:hypothetical protein